MNQQYTHDYVSMDNPLTGDQFRSACYKLSGGCPDIVRDSHTVVPHDLTPPWVGRYSFKKGPHYEHHCKKRPHVAPAKYNHVFVVTKYDGPTSCQGAGCNREAPFNGFCIKHFAHPFVTGRRREKTCVVDNCITNAQSGKNLCFAHGGVTKCIVQAYTAHAKHYGRCYLHGGTKTCSFEGCTTTSESRGLCYVHGGGTRKNSKRGTMLSNETPEKLLKKQKSTSLTLRKAVQESFSPIPMSYSQKQMINDDSLSWSPNLFPASHPHVKTHHREEEVEGGPMMAGSEDTTQPLHPSPEEHQNTGSTIDNSETQHVSQQLESKPSQDQEPQEHVPLEETQIVHAISSPLQDTIESDENEHDTANNIFKNLFCI